MMHEQTKNQLVQHWNTLDIKMFQQNTKKQENLRCDGIKREQRQYKCWEIRWFLYVENCIGEYICVPTMALYTIEFCGEICLENVSILHHKTHFSLNFWRNRFSEGEFILKYQIYACVNTGINRVPLIQQISRLVECENVKMFFPKFILYYAHTVKLSNFSGIKSGCLNNFRCLARIIFFFIIFDAILLPEQKWKGYEEKVMGIWEK